MERKETTTRGGAITTHQRDTRASSTHQPHMDGWDTCLGRRAQVRRGEEVDRGTVLYIGPVDGKKGIWAGVEWDRPCRGKHNGTYHGHTYFRCRKPGKYGSFLRPEALDFGVTLLQAIRNKYVEMETERTQEMYVHTVSEKKVHVQLVGENQVKQLQSNTAELQRVYLHGKRVSSVDQDREVAESVPNVKELDLSSNLINDWETVDQLADELRHLTLLDLSNNMLPQNCACLSGEHFQNLSVVVLNKCEIEWNTVYEAAHCMPNLQELHLCENELQDTEFLPNIDHVFSNLRRLNLDDNMIDDWSKLDWLKCLPNLEALQVSGNKLSEIRYTGGFMVLKSLMLARNEITEWNVIDELNMFPQLEELRITNNPISTEDNRFEMVSRISKLKVLNGSCISERERKDSEIKYLRMLLERQSSVSNDALLKDHPRFEELKTVHKIEHQLNTTATLRNESLKQSLYQTTIYCECSRSVCDKVKKNLPGTTTVAKLKMMCERLFKVPQPEQQLQLKDSGSSLYCLAEEDRTLSMLTTEFEIEIFVCEVNRLSMLDEQAATQRARELLESRQLEQVAEEMAEAQKERRESHRLAIRGQPTSQK
mmetsp:Transcript_9080/g.32222  ORF Transcript_9080/g.32222 Transcript_9080/m.32222 type:complete len:596 (+) Transcript_9080:1-1788(+)